MENNKQLAIVIPAYKVDYIDETLASVAAQTCRNFTVYVCNDAGSRDIGTIVSRYSDAVDIVYRRYDDNIGGRDLVEAWNRALSMMADEPFFMLFSDDDVMEPTCIARFYDELSAHPDHDVYHFNISIIDSQSRVIISREGFPTVLSALDFYIKNNIRGEIDVRMPEFIFRTSAFHNAGGFVSFPLAMHTDNATVMSVADSRGILTIDGPRVRWRISPQHISGSRSQPRQKHIQYLEADVSFNNWLYDRYFPLLSAKDKHAQRLMTLRIFADPERAVTMRQRREMLLRITDMSKRPYLAPIIPLLWAMKKVRRLFVKPVDD